MLIMFWQPGHTQNDVHVSCVHGLVGGAVRVEEDFHTPEEALPAHYTMCNSLGCPKN